MRHLRWGVAGLVGIGMLLAVGCNYTFVKQDEYDHLKDVERLYGKQTALVSALTEDKAELDNLLRAAQAARDMALDETRTAKEKAEAKAKLLAMMQTELNKTKQEAEQERARVAELESRLSQLRQELDKTKLVNLPGGISVVETPLGIALRLPNAILFAPGRATLTASGKNVIKQLAAMPEVQSPANLLNVCGFTDSDPIKRSGWKDNYQLSGERARTVMLELIKAGVDEKRVYFSGLGPRMLIMENGKENKAKSRRVEIYFHRIKKTAPEAGEKVVPK